MSTAPVGIFDSGVGGLSVAAEIRRVLPAEELLYFADTAYCPYGDRETEDIRARSVAIGRFLEERGAKVLVVACNTASGAALETLRETLSIPVIGLEPAVKPAVRESRVGRVGVMATTGTLRSERYARLVAAHGNGASVLPQPCPGLADAIEEGLLEGPELDRVLHPYVTPLRAAGVDTVVLGCTHYVFVSDAIQRGLGQEVRLIHSGPAIANRTRAILKEAGQLATVGEGSIRVLTTATVGEVEPVATRLWGESLPVEPVKV